VGPLEDGRLLRAKTITDLRWHPAEGYPQIYTVAFGPNGKLVAFGGSDNKVNVLNVKDATMPYSFAGDGSAIQGIAFSRDGQNLISSSRQGAIQTWRLN
jgi:WD40 repeat protein